MEAFLPYGLFLFVFALGLWLWLHSKNVVGRIIGGFLIAPTTALLLFVFWGYGAHVAPAIPQLGIQYDPGASGGLLDWLRYGAVVGVVPFIMTVLGIVGIAILLSFFDASIVGSSSSFKAIPDGFGGFNIHESGGGSDSSGCGCLIFAVPSIAAFPYGIMHGFSQWFLYRVGLHNSVTSSWLPILIAMCCIWVLAMILAVMPEIRKKNAQA